MYLTAKDRFLKPMPKKKKLTPFKPTGKGVRLSAAYYFYDLCKGKMNKCQPQPIRQPDGRTKQRDGLAVRCTHALGQTDGRAQFRSLRHAHIRAVAHHRRFSVPNVQPDLAPYSDPDLQPG